MSDDLVRRLRDTPNWKREEYGDYKYAGAHYDRAPFEAANRIEELEAKLSKAIEAMTPSGATKSEYMGKFWFPRAVRYEDDIEITVKTYVPWTTIKEIMSAILVRATLAELKGEQP